MINIIWDLDGVIADSERIWIENKRKLLNDTFNLDWDSETAFLHMGGTSDVTKKARLDKMGIITDDVFWEKAKELDNNSMANGEVKITPDVINIIDAYKNNQCIATGGVVDKTWNKIKSVGLLEYFNESNVFNASMVAKGKPEPDIFLYACDKMGWDKDSCVIIEDSLAGVTAGLKAGIKTIAFTGNFYMDKEKYIQDIKNIGDAVIFDTMVEVKNYIDNL